MGKSLSITTILLYKSSIDGGWDVIGITSYREFEAKDLPLDKRSKKAHNPGIDERLPRNLRTVGRIRAFRESEAGCKKEVRSS
jgi:hypothetical protein